MVFAATSTVIPPWLTTWAFSAGIPVRRGAYGGPMAEKYQFIGLNTNFGGISNMNARAPIGGFDGSG